MGAACVVLVAVEDGKDKHDKLAVQLGLLGASSERLTAPFCDKLRKGQSQTALKLICVTEI